MFSPRTRKGLAIIAFLLFAMLACNFPNNSPTATQDPGLIYTVAAQTLEAEMTQIAIPGSPTLHCIVNSIARCGDEYPIPANTNTGFANRHTRSQPDRYFDSL